MQQGTVIKVSDLLKKIGSSDEVSFENIMINDIVGLDSGGVSGNIIIQALDNGTLMVTIDSLICTIHDISDFSQKPFVREVEVYDYMVRFTDDFDASSQEAFDEIFPIDKKSETIDLGPVFRHAILLQEPISKIAPGEEEFLVDEDADDYSSGASMLGNVSFK